MADLRKAADLPAQVLERVRSRTPNGNNHHVVSVQDRFLNGSLYTVAFEITGADGLVASYFNRAYVTKRAITVYEHDNELLTIVGEVHSRSF